MVVERAEHRPVINFRKRKKEVETPELRHRNRRLSLGDASTRRVVPSRRDYHLEFEPRQLQLLN